MSNYTIFKETDGWTLRLNDATVAIINLNNEGYQYYLTQDNDFKGWMRENYYSLDDVQEKVVQMHQQFLEESSPGYVRIVKRFVSKIETDEWDDCFCDKVWYDRQTGKEIARYDYADPANRDPDYGGQDTDYYIFERRNLDMDEMIPKDQAKEI